MELDLYQIDAFTNTLFQGNPACVVPLQTWLPDETMLQIAKENAVAETAFFIKKADRFHLRWFTPDIEMDLCGHATLATAHCIKSHLAYSSERIIFDTLSGELSVSLKDGIYYLDLPSRMPNRADLPDIIAKSLNIAPLEVFKSRDYVLVYDDEASIKKIQVNRTQFDTINLDPGGVIVTAKGDDCDFVSRFFTPQASILEDPVTGSAHCSLVPFWASRLQKTDFVAKQLSERGGVLFCQEKGKRVIVGGQAITYSYGKIFL